MKVFCFHFLAGQSEIVKLKNKKKMEKNSKKMIVNCELHFDSPGGQNASRKANCNSTIFQQLQMS